MEYPIKSLIDMARIPADRWEAFASEIPVMLGIIAPIVAMHDLAKDAGGEVSQSDYDALLNQALWVDDDKRTASVKMTVTGEEEPFLDTKFKFGVPS